MIECYLKNLSPFLPLTTQMSALVSTIVTGSCVSFIFNHLLR